MQRLACWRPCRVGIGLPRRLDRIWQKAREGLLPRSWPATVSSYKCSWPRPHKGHSRRCDARCTVCWKASGNASRSDRRIELCTRNHLLDGLPSPMPPRNGYIETTLQVLVITFLKTTNFVGQKTNTSQQKKMYYLLAFSSWRRHCFSYRIFSIIHWMACSKAHAVCAGKMLNSKFFSWSRAKRNNKFPSTHSRRSKNARRMATSFTKRK